MMRTIRMMAALATMALALGTWTARAYTLQADIANISNGDTLTGESFTIQGTAQNADAQGAFTPGGLRAFYFRDAGRVNFFGVSQPLPDVPQPGELQQGTNSEFAPGAQNSGNWWINDSGQSLPPFVTRKFLQQTANPGDDQTWQAENFGLRMEGRATVASDGTYNFTGGADDVVRVYVDGQKVFDNWASYAYPGNAVSLNAGSHAFTAEFGEGGGGQYYSFNLPAGIALEANAPDEHTFAGYTLDYGKVFAERRPGLLTTRFESGTNGGASIGSPIYYANGSVGNFGNDIGPSPLADGYRMIMNGYWYVPADGLYDFIANADDRFAFAISDNPSDDPDTIARLMDNDGTLPSSLTDVPLTQGWRPVRFEFGEGGGGANYWFQYQLASNGYTYFAPSALESTDDPVFDWVSLDHSLGQVSAGDLFTWEFPDSLHRQNVQLRLRTYGTDTAYAEEILSVRIVIPEPASLIVLGLGALVFRRRRG